MVQCITLLVMVIFVVNYTVIILSIDYFIFTCTEYVTTLMDETIRIVSSGQKLRGTQEELRGRPPLCSGHDTVNKEEAVQQALEMSRFAKD